MNDTKKIAKSTITYFIGNVLSKIIVFFMLPLYTKYIPAGDMGYYDTTIAVATFFASVLFLDIGAGIMRFMFEQKEKEDKNYPIYTGMVIFLFSLALYIAIAITIGFVFSFQYFFWIALYGFFLCLTTLYGYVARGWHKNTDFAISGLISTIVNITSNLIFILLLGWNYKALYISFCLGMFFRIAYLELKCKVIINFSKKYFDKELFIVIFKFSLPLALNSVAFWLLTSANKVIVSTMLDTTQNGYLAIANKFTSLLYLFSTCFQLAWQELAFSKENKIGSLTIGSFYSKAYNLYTKILLMGLLIALPIVKIAFPFFINVSYNDSSPLIPLAFLGTIMSILSAFLGSIFGGIKKTNIIFISTLVGAIVNIIVIFSLINIMGVMSANIAFLAGYTVNVLFRTIVLKKVMSLEVKYWYFIVFIPVFIVATLIYNNFNWVYNLLFFVAMCGIGVIVLRKELKEIIRKLNYKKKNKKEQ